MSKIPESFCFIPWTGIYINSNTSGPCCVNYKLFKESDAEKYLISDELNDLKKSFIKGEKHPSCKTCWKREELGITSVRQRNSVDYKDYYYFTIRLSNKCNFTCRMCHPKFSSAWTLDTEASSLKDPTNPEPFSFDSLKKNIDFILNIAKDKKVTIVIIGGEPLISDEFLYFLEECNKYRVHNNIKLSVNTNLSVSKYKNISYKEEFDKFYMVEIHASIDGIGKVGEYIRRGFKQSIFDKNLKYLKKYINTLNVTLQLYNIYDIPNIYKYSENNNIRISLNYLDFPLYLSICILDKEERDKILIQYDKLNFINEEVINSIIREKYIDYQIPRFISYTNSLDTLWKTNFIKSIPEFKSWYERIKNE